MKLLILACLLITLPVMAQERTAGGALQTQASWGALKSMVDKTNGDVRIIQIDMGEMKKCAALGKLWIAGQGCVNAKSDDYDQILLCGSTGKVYNPNTKQCLMASPPRWAYYVMGEYAGGNSGLVGRWGLTNTPCTSTASSLGTCSEGERGQLCYTHATTTHSCGGGQSDHGNCSTTGFTHIYKCI